MPYLPQHWSYAEPWEFDPEERTYEDLRGRGAQVTDRASWIAEAVLGADLDGQYDRYRWVLVIDAQASSDSSGAWYAVEPEDVVRVSVVLVAEFKRWLKGCLRQQKVRLGLLQEGDLEFAEDEVASWLHRNAVPTPVPWVETLPRPT